MAESDRRPLAMVYAETVVRLRWVVVVGVFGVLALLTLDGIPGFGRDGLTLRELAPVGAPEIETELLAVEKFRYPLNARTQVVRRDPDGLLPRVQRQDAREAYRLTRAAQADPVGPIALVLPFANTLRVFPSSTEAGTTTITNLVGFPGVTLSSREDAAEAVAAQLREAGAGRVSVTGGVPAQLETGRLIRAHLNLLQLLTITALVVLTAVWQRSLVVPLVVIGTIGATVLTMLHLLAAASAREWVTVPAEVLPVVLSVAIGVATDYVLFYLGAFRRWVVTTDPLQATRAAVAETAPVVLPAGTTTAIGAASLLVADTGFIRAFAPGLVVACLAATVVALVLTPALIAVFSRVLLWPAKAPTEQEPGPWARRLAGSRPFAVGTSAAIMLTIAALASQATASPLGFNIVTGLPDDTEIAQGAQDAADGFAAGILSPTLILVTGEGLNRQLPALSAFSRAVAEQPGVAGVIGSSSFEDGLRRTGLAEEFPTAARAGNRGLLVTEDGAYARLIVVLEDEAFTGIAAESVAELRRALPRLLAESGLAEGSTAAVAGDTALVARVNAQLTDDLFRVALVLLVLEIGILYLALRSWRTAGFVVFASLLITAAAIGSVSIVDRTLGQGNGIAFFVPIAAFVLLVSIGVDYGVLMGKALDAGRQGGLGGPDLAAATMTRASPTIVQAGSVLLVSFALLAVVPIQAFTQFAVVMAVGVGLDTSLVRPVVMPLLLSGTLTGRRAASPAGERDLSSVA